MGELEIFGRSLFDMPDLEKIILQFAINFTFLFILIKGIYMNVTKNREHIFPFFIFNIVIFFLCIMLSSVKLKMGMAFGLFAILSILRYRTETVPIKEMTFLFISLILGVINSLVNKEVSIMEIVFTNGMIVGATFIIERLWLKSYITTQTVKYEKIELIKPGRKAELIADLTDRLGHDITDVEISKIDFLTDTAMLKVFYSEQDY